MIKIIGAKGKILNVDEFLKKISVLSENHDVIMQVFDASMVFGKAHLNSAVEHALRAIKRKTNSTNTLDKEIMLYASGERQIKKAIPKMGIKKGCEEIVLVLFNKENNYGEKISDKILKNILKQLDLKHNDSVLEGNYQKLLDFGLSKDEIETVTKDKYEFLILEKVAMVDVIK
jgi:KEOPS complex subunit Cgi121